MVLILTFLTTEKTLEGVMRGGGDGGARERVIDGR